MSLTIIEDASQLDGDVILLDPDTQEVVSSPFWQRERPWSVDENMTANAIVFKWRCGTIDSATAINTLIAYDVFDYDTVMELLSGYLMTLAKVEG
jgi:hypothetical protein